MIAKIWMWWAIVAVLALIPVYFMERSAKKVDGASGWILFGWIELFVIVPVFVLTLVSLVIWLT